MSSAIDLEGLRLTDFSVSLSKLVDGYTVGGFRGRHWGVTVRRSPDRRRLWLYGEELGGRDIVSFNLYAGSGDKPLLKPCEMSSTKVIEFVLYFQPDRSATPITKDDRS